MKPANANILLATTLRAWDSPVADGLFIFPCPSPSISKQMISDLLKNVIHVVVSSVFRFKAVEDDTVTPCCWQFQMNSLYLVALAEAWYGQVLVRWHDDIAILGHPFSNRMKIHKTYNS